MEILIIILYFVPTLVAMCKGHDNVSAVGALNLFLGWTFIGWVLALVWALAGGKK